VVVANIQNIPNIAYYR